MSDVKQFPTAGGQAERVDIIGSQDAIDDLLAEVHGLGNTLVAITRENGGVDPLYVLILEQAGLRIARNVIATREIVRKIAAAARGGKP